MTELRKSHPQETTVPAKRLRIISGHRTAEQFTPMHEKVDSGVGATFWGLRLPDQLGRISSRPDTLRYRWANLIDLLQAIPYAGRDYETGRHSKLNYYDILKIVERTKDGLVQFEHGADFAVRITNLEAYNDPAIRYAAVKKLQGQGNPAIEVVRKLEEWRIGSDFDLTSYQLELGRIAFETFLFYTGDDTLIPALGAAALAFQNP